MMHRLAWPSFISDASRLFDGKKLMVTGYCLLVVVAVPRIY